MRSFCQLLREIFWVPWRRYLRYSRVFTTWRTLFTYHPQEELIDNAYAFLSASQVVGDYLEFGVYQGWTFVAAYHLAHKYDFNNMHFYAFDSFSGLPPISGVDESKYQQYEEGQYTCSIDMFKKNITRHGVDQDKVTIVPGWFASSLNEGLMNELSLSKAALVWIDCDLYASTAPVLEFITGYLQDGTILVFDDWFAFRGDPNRGEQLAFRQWLQANPNIQASQFMKMGWHGNSFVINLV
jgi:hypothetical protein